jgi:methanogenic corrinoid protein MtbC1
MADKLVDALANMKEEEAFKIASDMLASGQDPLHILDLCREGLDVVGKRFEKGEYFLPELMMAGEMLGKISELVKPKLVNAGNRQKLGKIVLGTVEGDIHDIGKDIVAFMLDINGFEVHDLGVDVPVNKFIEAIKQDKPQVVALSGFLTLAYDAMKRTVDAMKEAGLRNNVKIMIGGGQIDDQIKNYVGADAYGKDAMAGVVLAKGWLGAK